MNLQDKCYFKVYFWGIAGNSVQVGDRLWAICESLAAAKALVARQFPVELKWEDSDGESSGYSMADCHILLTDCISDVPFSVEGWHICPAEVSELISKPLCLETEAHEYRDSLIQKFNDDVSPATRDAFAQLQREAVRAGLDVGDLIRRLTEKLTQTS